MMHGGLPGVPTTQAPAAASTAHVIKREGLSAPVQALLPGIDCEISQYRKMLTEVKAAFKQVNATASVVYVHTSMHNEEDPPSASMPTWCSR